MKNKRNYYRVLHVQPDAPKEIIRSSYRTMMQKLRMHPDLGGDDWNASLINEAYEVLTNTQHRAAYDKTRPQVDRSYSKAENTNVARSRVALANSECMFCGLAHDHAEKLLPQDLCERCDSPLYPLDVTHREESDRRSISRVPNNHSIVFTTYWPQPNPSIGRTDDISLNGMKFFSQTNLEVGQLINIDSPMLKAVARIVRCKLQGSEWVCAAEFMSLRFARSRGSFVAERV